MKKIIASLITLLIISTSCSDLNSAEVNRPKTPEELRMELLSQEKLEPQTYLSVDATMQEDEIKTRDAGLFHDAEYSLDGNTIHGTIKNTATMAKFKDIVVTVTFYSQTETAIETKDFVIYEFYEPNSSNKFELKVYPPEAMAKFGIEIKGATASD
jgi:hypothetical protein